MFVKSIFNNKNEAEENILKNFWRILRQGDTVAHMQIVITVANIKSHVMHRKPRKF